MAGLDLNPPDLSGYVSFNSFCTQEDPPMAPRGPVEKPWQEDTKSCSICRAKFGDIMNRRHHCRACGKCVCHDCSPNQMQLDGSGVVRVCNPCVLNGAGALELLPALAHLREELCSFGDESDFASLPPAQHPAQAVAECVAAVAPLRKKMMVQEGNGDQKCQPLATVGKSLLSAELAKEKERRQKLESKLGVLMQGMSQLEEMLKGLNESADANKGDDCGSDNKIKEKSSKSNRGSDDLRQMERMLASCTLSAGVWLHRKKGGEYKRPVPVLSRMLTENESNTVSPASASTTVDSSDSSDYSDSESGDL